MLELYTDGSWMQCGAVGYAAVLYKNGVEVSHWSAGANKGGSNQAELLAVILGLEKLPPGSRVTVFTDSQYIIENADKPPSTWSKANAKDVPDWFLWKRVGWVSQTLDVSFAKVKSHSSCFQNKRADKLAREKAEFYRDANAAKNLALRRTA